MDNETPTPFAFQTPPAAGETQAPSNPPPRRGRRQATPKAPKAPKAPKKPRRQVTSRAQTATPPTNSPAPARQRRAKKPRTAKIELATAMTALAGLQPDDAKLLTGIVQALNNESKGSRIRIVAALGKIFA